MEKEILLFSDGYSISEIARGTEAECREIMTNKLPEQAMATVIACSLLYKKIPVKYVSGKKLW